MLLKSHFNREHTTCILLVFGAWGSECGAKLPSFLPSLQGGEGGPGCLTNSSSSQLKIREYRATATTPLLAPLFAEEQQAAATGIGHSFS